MSDPSTTNEAEVFENLLVQLQELVARLESNELSLDDALSTYERSVDIANQCSKMLDDAELRVARIDAQSRTLREDAFGYRLDAQRAASLLLGDDEVDLADLLEDE